MNVNIDPETVALPAVPASLRVGDIIRCIIPTDIDGRREYPWRNALVAGLECVPGEPVVRGLHLVRFSYNLEKFNPDFELEITQPMQAEWGLSGFYKTVLLRTNRIDLVPVDEMHFQKGIKIIGSVAHPEFFEELAAHLQRGLVSQEAETSRILHRNFYGTELRQTLDPHAAAPAPQFNLAQIAGITRASFTDSVDYDIALDDKARRTRAWSLAQDFSSIVAAQRNARRFRDVPDDRPASPPVSVRPAQALPSERDYVSRYQVKPATKAKGRKARIERDRAVSRVNGQIRRMLEQAGVVERKTHPPVPLQTPAPRPRAEAKPFRPRFVPLPPQVVIEDVNPVLGDIITGAPQPKERKTEPSKAQSGTITVTAAAKALKASLLQKKAARDYVPQVHDELHRGDIVFADVIDFVDGAEKRGNSRPCVVWDVYENGEGKIIGLDLLGCTRQLGQFTHAVEVHNVTNPTLWDGGKVITEKLIRVPLTAQYFPLENKHRNFYNPYFIEVITQQRAELALSGLEQAPYGLSEIPADWKRREPRLRPHTEKTLAAAARFEKERLAQAPVITGEDVVPGSVIMRAFRNAAGDTRFHPALVWGIWRHNDSNAIVALDTMRISMNGKQSAWEITDRKLAEALENDNAVIQVARVDMTPNVPFFFDGNANAPLTQLEPETLRRLERERVQALLKVRHREGTMPRMIHPNWERTAGFTHHVSPQNLAAPGIFAPDVPALAKPGRKREPATRYKPFKARPS